MLRFALVLALCAFFFVFGFIVRPAVGEAAHTAQNQQLRVELKKARHQAKGWRSRAVVNQRRARRWKTAAQNDGSVNEALALASRVYGVSLSAMRSVAFCESRFSPSARNGQYRGLFQEGPMFERGPFGDFSVWSPYANAFTAAYTVSREGWRQWECKP